MELEYTFSDPFVVPDWATQPKIVRTLDVVKDGKLVMEFSLKESYYVLGKDRQLASLPAQHASVSGQHAALVYKEDQLYVIDLKSRGKTYLDKEMIETCKPVPFMEGSFLKLAESTRFYVLRDSRKRRANVTKQYSSKKVKKANNGIRCRHILVKHDKSRNPYTWKNPTVKVERSELEARNMIAEYRTLLITKRGQQIPFETLAESVSECSSAKKGRGGDLGMFYPGMMQPEFEKAAFSLEINEISKPVSTNSGIHLIKRLQ